MNDEISPDYEYEILKCNKTPNDVQEILKNGIINKMKGDSDGKN